MDCGDEGTERHYLTYEFTAIMALAGVIVQLRCSDNRNVNQSSLSSDCTVVHLGIFCIFAHPYCVVLEGARANSPAVMLYHI